MSVMDPIFDFWYFDILIFDLLLSLLFWTEQRQGGSSFINFDKTKICWNDFVYWYPLSMHLNSKLEACQVIL